MQATWDGVDKIYCITLANRLDRQTEARSQFANVGLADLVEFIIVEKHPDDCEQGIYESHLLCMRKGIDAGAQRILIFEDDVTFDGVVAERVAHAMDFINRHPSWHMLFLGCMVSRMQTTGYPSIVRIRYRSLTHGYVIHRRFAEFFLSQPWQKVPFDDLIKHLKDRQTYMVSPAVAFQSNSRSDNERYLPLDRFRRWCGGLKKLQQRNEFYHRHKILIIAAHMLVCALILWVVVQ